MDSTARARGNERWLEAQFFRGDVASTANIFRGAFRVLRRA